MDPSATAAKRAASSAPKSEHRAAISAATASTGGGRRVRRRQRERMVGSKLPGLCDTSRTNAWGGGSSSTFKSALAALRFMSSAQSTTTTRQAPSPAVLLRKPLTARMASMVIWPLRRPVFSSKARSTTIRSAWLPAKVR